MMLTPGNLSLQAPLPRHRAINPRADYLPLRSVLWNFPDTLTRFHLFFLTGSKLLEIIGACNIGEMLS